MARLQDFQTVTPASTDNILIVQPTGQGLATFGSTIGSKASKSDIASISITGSTNNTGLTIKQGTYFYLNGNIVRAKTDIANGATLTSGTNYETITAGSMNEGGIIRQYYTGTTSGYGNLTLGNLFDSTKYVIVAATARNKSNTNTVYFANAYQNDINAFGRTYGINVRDVANYNSVNNTVIEGHIFLAPYRVLP